MTRPIEDMATEVSDQLRQQIQRQSSPFVACYRCKGTGVEVTESSHLWGHNCWFCAGWAYVLRGSRPQLIGPFDPRPSIRN